MEGMGIDWVFPSIFPKVRAAFSVTRTAPPAKFHPASRMTPTPRRLMVLLFLMRPGRLGSSPDDCA